MKSFLEIYDFGTQTSRTVWQTPDHVEAPNWSPDGSFLVFNGGGLIYRLDLSEGAQPVHIDTGFATGCNNDHGISPDGSLLVISDKTETGKSCIYTLPIEGGTPQRVTEEVPSWWHGWSPDGMNHAYTAVRDGTFMICTCAVDGGDEIQVVGGGGHYDGPDYTPDGKWIWFNSDREGGMQLWRVRPDGSDLQKMTDDERVNWFPHPSPDGKHVLYLAYEEGTEGHPADREVELRLLSAEGGAPRTLISLFGGQGTINVPCWSPDSGSIAYVRYART